ncbi:helix-turn-helix domain-containing protein [Enterovibrio nigricans]|uniref:Regulatory helix-turn-helix protein, lysR family n=1 Tax=Enterovibrio nigricans DSM 22720 TaxID=1121868 RepID=A0A1T4V8P4_9GAMM|nr:LysR family transcriptional regulator [Enterovibrio nigricans]SKA60901.1 regulatory helix-turn-helix protein, lysR family [Enterovibrio nigricans DSM 22720]
MHTIEQLTAFISVYEKGSYSAAAAALGKSRTTVREHVMAYEDTLGYSLFVIEGKKRFLLTVPTSFTFMPKWWKNRAGSCLITVRHCLTVIFTR